MYFQFSTLDNFKEVRCCCDATLLGLLPESEAINAGLNLRELEDGSFAFDSNHNKELVESLPGFVPAEAAKTWKKETKTWRKK